VFAGTPAVNDSSGEQELASAERIDGRLSAAVDGVKQLGGLFQVGLIVIQLCS